MTFDPEDVVPLLDSKGSPQTRVLFIKKLIITLGGFFLSILGATPNGFNFFARKLQTDMHLTDTELALLSGLGLLGLNFTFPVGYVLDRWGPVKLSLVAVVGIVGGMLDDIRSQGSPWYVDTANWILHAGEFDLVAG